MSAYRQILRMGDYQGDVLWEMVISADYSKCFAGNIPLNPPSKGDVQDVDIFNIESIKFEGETLTLQQKDDEFSFSMQEYAAKTEADNEAVALMKSAEYSDVWVVLFEHELAIDSEAYDSMSFDRMVFSGLVRRKASAEDLLWNGEQWESNPNPVRSWKFSAQAFGAAVMDTVNLASKKIDEETTIAGVLDQITIVENMNPELGRWGQLEWMFGKEITSTTTYQGAVWLSDVLFAILNKAQERIEKNIRGFEISTVATETAFTYAVQVSSVETATNENARKYSLLSNSFSGFMIDKRLVKPLMNDDGITPAPDYGMSWHRFESLTELLYNLSVCFGTQLRIKNIGGNKIEIRFAPINEGAGKHVQIIDAVKADLDIQSTKISESEKYYCQATDLCKDGYASCYKNSGEDYATLKDTKETPKGGNALPLSVSLTTQIVSSSNSPIPQNCDWDGMSEAGRYPSEKTYKMAWTGMLGKKNSSEIGIVRAVATTIEGKAYWYDKLSDCLNSKISANGEYHKTEYKLEMPYIKSFRRTTPNPEETTPNPSEGGELRGSLRNVELFDKITLDGKEYIITSIEIKPTEGTVSIKMSRSSRYGFAEPSEPIFGKIEVPNTADVYNSFAPTQTEIAGEPIEANSLVMRGADSRIYNYLNIEAQYGQYCGVAVRGAAENDSVIYRTAGDSYSDSELIVGKPVYARATEETTPNPSEGGELRSKVVASSLRLNERTETEQSDIRIGFAKAAHTWQMQLGNEFIIE